MKPRVFVSSVIEGFEDCRQAAKNGIIDAGGDPVLVEDFPSSSVSPRTACLDGVHSCDVIVIIVGERGGWTAPSGKLVVEEEYGEARRGNRKVLAFIQDIGKDEEAQRLADSLSHYTDGLFRKTFTSPGELRANVKDAVKSVIQHFRYPEVDISMIQEKVQHPDEIYGETTLRFVLNPKRVEEVIDPVSLESDDLERNLMGLGHAPGIDLFSYKCSKGTHVGINEIVILQSDERRGGHGRDFVRLEISTTGIITIDTNVTGLSKDDDRFSGAMAIFEGDIVERLNKCFAFASAFFDTIDKFKRYDPVLYNASLGGIRYRTLMTRPSSSGSYSMRMGGDEVVIAFDKPRVITRVELADFQKYTDQTLALFRRRLKE